MDRSCALGAPLKSNCIIRVSDAIFRHITQIAFGFLSAFPFKQPMRAFCFPRLTGLVSSLLLAVVVLAATSPHAALAGTVSVSFSRGFIGTQGTSSNAANNISIFPTLGISSGQFLQESATGQFLAQGNDIPGTLRLFLNGGAVIDVPGIINWRHTLNGSIVSVGFLPSATNPVQSFAYGAGLTFTLDSSRTYGLEFGAAGFGYTEGSDISGNAATSSVLTALNNYLVLSGTPAMTVTKTADTSGLSLVPQVGEAIIYRITVENTGTVTLGTVSLADALTTDEALTADAGVTDDGLLDVGETWVWTARHVLSQADLDAGLVSNLAIATATPPSGQPFDVESSAAGNATPGAGQGSSTDVTLSAAPGAAGVALVKTAVLNDDDGKPGLTAGDSITYRFTLTNTGQVPLSNLVVTDPDAIVTGGPLAVLAVGATDTATFTAVHVLSQTEIDAGSVSNSALVTASSPQGTEDVTDLSGTATDNGDPTVTLLTGAVGEAGITQDLVTLERLFPTIYRATVRIVVSNTGPVTLSGLNLDDDLANYVGASALRSVTDVTLVSAPSGIALDPAFDGAAATGLLAAGAALAPGERIEIEVTFEFDSSTGFPAGQNEATLTANELPVPVSGHASLGGSDFDRDGAIDATESATEDRDGDGIPDARDYDPTGYFYCENDGRILTGGGISVSWAGGSNSSVGTQNGITILRDGSDGRYQWYVSAPGLYTMAVTTPVGIGQASRTRTVQSAVVDVTSLGADPVVLGGTEVGSTGYLSDYSAAGNPFYLVFDIGVGDPNIMANNIPVELCSGNEVSVSATQDGAENQSGAATKAVFTVLLGRPAAVDTVVTYNVAGTATAGSDYTALIGTITIPAGQTTGTIPVPVLNDQVAEDPETVVLSLTGVTGEAGTALAADAAARTALVRIADSLLRQIGDPLARRLAEDLRVTMLDQGRRMSDFARGASAGLRAGPLDEMACATGTALDPDGTATVQNGTATVDGTLHADIYDCARNERRIQDTEFSLRRDADGKTSSQVAFALRREHRADDQNLRGRFLNGYVKLPPHLSGQDRITGAGVSLGVYGAKKLEGDRILDHYLALGVGRHSFRLTFGSIDPILARGSYNYLAAYGGLAVSREGKIGDQPVTFRTGADLAAGVPSSADVLATQTARSEHGTVDLSNVFALRLYGQAEWQGDRQDAAHGYSQGWDLRPRVFCDLSHAVTSRGDCGLGLAVEWSRLSPDRSSEYAVRLNGQATRDAQDLGVMLSHIHHFWGRNGTSETGMTLGADGRPSVDYNVKVSF